MAIDVFSYLDYRKLLAEHYASRKRESKTFSYRVFARRVGVSAPNHLKRVIERERNLSPETARKYAAALGLAGDAAAYFCELVRFDQAKSPRERSDSYRRLTRYRGYQRAQRLDAHHDRYHSQWYFPAIREMVSLRGFESDPRWIASRLVPPITERQAAEALEVLTELRMIERAEDGRVTRSEDVVSTGPETRNLHVAHYHMTMMQHAMQSMTLSRAQERDISSVTLCVPVSAVAELKERVREWRKEVIARESPSGEGERVVHVAIQVFPLTREPDAGAAPVTASTPRSRARAR